MPGAKKLDCYCALRFEEKKQCPNLEIETDCILRFEKKQRPVLEIETDCTLRFEKKQRSVLENETDCALRFKKYLSLIKENLVYSKHENNKQLTWRW